MNDRALWDDASTEIFVYAMVDQILKKERRGLSFSKDGWEAIIATFNEKTGKAYDKKQLKNKFDMLRKDLRTWDALIKETGVGREPGTGNVVASAEWWQRKCQENSAYRKFRRSALKNERELRLIFKDVVATGEDGLNPSFIQTQTQDAEEEDVYRPTMVEEEGSGDSEDENFGVDPALSTGVTDELASVGLSSQTPPCGPGASSVPTPGASSVPTNSGSQGKRRRVDKFGKKKKQKMPASKQIADAVSVMAEASQHRATTISEIQQRSVDAAIEDLLEILEVREDENFKFRCVRLIMDKTSRDTFLSLLKRDKDSIVGWLRYMVTTLD